MDDRFENILAKDIVQDVPLLYIIKIYLALLEVENDESFNE